MPILKGLCMESGKLHCSGVCGSAFREFYQALSKIQKSVKLIRLGLGERAGFITIKIITITGLLIYL